MNMFVNPFKKVIFTIFIVVIHKWLCSFLQHKFFDKLRSNTFPNVFNVFFIDNSVMPSDLLFFCLKYSFTVYPWLYKSETLSLSLKQNTVLSNQGFKTHICKRSIVCLAYFSLWLSLISGMTPTHLQKDLEYHQLTPGAIEAHKITTKSVWYINELLVDASCILNI